MSQKKHELLQNELVDVIESNYDKIKPYMSQIILISTAVILGVLAIFFWTYTIRTINEGQWEDFLYSTQFAEIRGMEDVAKVFPDTAAGQYALIRVADYDYNRGATNIVSNRDDFNDKVRKAIERYELLATKEKVDPFVKRRAVFGLGHSHESLGEFGPAREYYQQLIDNAPDDPITVLARKGITRLDSPSVVGIFEKFKKWEPATTAPETDPLPPARPDISFPSATQEGKDSDSATDKSDFDGAVPANETSPADDNGVDKAAGESDGGSGDDKSEQAESGDR